MICEFFIFESSVINHFYCPLEEGEKKGAYRGKTKERTEGKIIHPITMNLEKSVAIVTGGASGLGTSSTTPSQYAATTTACVVFPR